jgi:flavin prenyltransferase
MKKEFVIGVTGASGACYARRLLEILCRDADVHLIISGVGAEIAAYEGVSLEGFDATYTTSTISVRPSQAVPTSSTGSW